MNKTALRTFAIAARQELLRRVTDRAAIYGISEKTAGNPVPSAGYQKPDGSLLTPEEIRQRDALIRAVAARGFRQVMEEAAYTWFNRLTALRYMEAHGLLPVLHRVLPRRPGEIPQIVAEAQDVLLPGVSRETVLTMIEENRTEALYKLLLIALCNVLNPWLPQMFEPIGDETELLFPDGLLRPDSVLARMSELAPEDWQSIEVIGWLYQYYISERHNEVVNINGGAIGKDDIPAATCLYTTDWVVRYMIQNSLGRLWLEVHPDKALKMKWPYYFDETEQTPETTQRLATLRRDAARLRPEEITVLDPCMGSGHMLVAAFDVLMDIYRFQGYTDRDAVRSIVENNLFGLDIDNRAAQLGYFAVMMKACEYDPRFLHRGVQPHVCTIVEGEPLTDDQWALFGEEADTARTLHDLFSNAKLLGSLLFVDVVPQGALAALRAKIETLAQGCQPDGGAVDYTVQDAVKKMLPLVEQAEILRGKYDVVATNPPYMNKFGDDMKRYLQAYFSDYKSDLFSVFMARNFDFCKSGGYSAFMTPYVWMFIKSYEALREQIIRERSIVTLVQMEYSAFEEATVPLCTFVLRNLPVDYRGVYLRLTDFKGGMEVQKQKVLEANEVPKCSYLYTATPSNFTKIPGAPVAYWASQRILEAFRQGKNIGDLSIVRTGMQTGKNELFVRLWFEVEDKKCKLNATSCKEAVISAAKYFPYNKGGEYRKWYGNNEYVVDWENKGYRIFHNSKEERRKTINYPDELKFSPSVTWSLITSGESSFRYKDNAISDIAGMSLYNAGMRTKFYLALCNSKICSILLKILSPTLNTQAGDMARIPVIFSEQKEKEIIDLSEENVSISKSDWDSFETSWDFKKHPLI